jgi:2-polyprenyl-6-methoxyphenol hydroxylase-like FAD-dependent oxidoreductase
VRVVDAASGSFEGSRGKGVQPRTLEIFDLIGVAEDVVASSTLYPYLKLHLGPFSKRLAPLGTRHEPTEERPYPNMLMVPQWRTNEILLARFNALGGKIEYNSAVASLTQTDRCVTVELATGESVKADYMVGCDGGRSTVRGLLGIQLVGKSLDEKAMVVADLEIENLDREFWHVWPINRGGPPSLCPLPLDNPRSPPPDDLARECCRHFAFCIPYSRYGLAVEDRQVCMCMCVGGCCLFASGSLKWPENY